MQVKHWLVVVSMLVLAASGCRERNPYLCPGGIDCPEPGGPCASSGECGAPTPVCNEEIMTCVECTENRHCRTGEVCDQNICAECQMDTDCESGLCLADKTCAGIEEVAYVDGAAVATNPCTKAEPCATLDKALTLQPLPKYIKATGTLVKAGAVTINEPITIYGDPGRTKIMRSDDKDEVLILKGMGNPEIVLYDLEIQGNTTAGADRDCVEIAETASVTMTRVDVHGHVRNGIRLAMSAKLVAIESQIHDNVLAGVEALTGTTTIELRRSRIYNHGGPAVNTTNAIMVTIESSVITANKGTSTSGGVSITGPFTIRNSIITNNGALGVTTVAGGLNLNPVMAGNAKFEFNTVSDNQSISGTGLVCNIFSFSVTNSILTGNGVSNCTLDYSLVTAGATGTNKNGDPMFKTRSLGDPAFYRIGSASDAINSADPNATLNVDIDGEKRGDDQRDMGADEFK